MRECPATRKLCRALEKQGAITYPLIAGKKTPIGWPDRFVAHAKWSGFLEMKARGGRIGEAQAQRIQQLRDRGVAAFVLRFDPLTIEGYGPTTAETLFDDLVRAVHLLDGQ